MKIDRHWRLWLLLATLFIIVGGCATAFVVAGYYDRERESLLTVNIPAVQEFLATERELRVVDEDGTLEASCGRYFAVAHMGGDPRERVLALVPSDKAVVDGKTGFFIVTFYHYAMRMEIDDGLEAPRARYEKSEGRIVLRLTRAMQRECSYLLPVR